MTTTNPNKVKVCVVRTAGTNCDEETARAFRHFKAAVSMVHINDLIGKTVSLKDFHILAVPGGFTYGDDIESGRILANQLRLKLADDLRKFIDDKKLIIGICNGFQVLVKAGILPSGTAGEKGFVQTVTLTNNNSGKFEDRWTTLTVEGQSVWVEGLPRRVYFPVAHAEGKFVTAGKNVLDELEAKGQVAFRYVTENGEKPVYPDNPNGSVSDIAGITDPTGRVLGLMPHPERHFLFENHPRWTRMKKTSPLGDGAKIFENGVKYVRQNF